MNYTSYPREVTCLKCQAPILDGNAYEIQGINPYCGECASRTGLVAQLCVPCGKCGGPATTLFYVDAGLLVCGKCRYQPDHPSPAQSPVSTQKTTSATAPASPAGVAAGERRVWYDRPLITVGLPIGTASLLLIAAAVDRVVDSGAPWREVTEILSAMAPVLGTFAILIALALGWLLRGLSKDLVATRDGGPEADAGLQADYNEAVEALKDAQTLIISHHDYAFVKLSSEGWCPKCHRPDGTEPEHDRIHAVIQRHNNRNSCKA